MHVVIPSNYNIQKKTRENMGKYIDLQIDCQRILNKKVEVITVIIGATGIVDRNIKSCIGKISGSYNTYNL